MTSQELEYKFIIVDSRKPENDKETWEPFDGNRKITLTTEQTDRNYTKTIKESFGDLETRDISLAF